MVSNPRKKTGLSRIRPLKQPALVQVKDDEYGMPITVVMRRLEVRVISILDMWEIVDEWWKVSPIARRYYRATLEGGKNITVFRDLISGAWYEQQV